MNEKNLFYTPVTLYIFSGTEISNLYRVNQELLKYGKQKHSNNSGWMTSFESLVIGNSQPAM